MLRIYGHDYWGFVYIWYDRSRKMYCIGSHMGDVEDGYVTCTGYMGQAYRRRPAHFMRRILHWEPSRDKKRLQAIEQRWLNLINDSELLTSANRKSKTVRYYNMKKTASGGSGKQPNRSSSHRRKIGENARKRWAHPEWRKRVTEKLTIKNRERGMLGISDSLKKKISIALTGRTRSKTHCASLRDSKIGKTWWTNGQQRLQRSECPGEGWIRGFNRQP